MAECALNSFLLTGMVEQSALEQLGYQAVDATLDEKAEVLFLGQLYGSIFTVQLIECIFIRHYYDSVTKPSAYT